MSVMLTMTGPSSRGRVVETLRARSRLVASIVASIRDSDESGETCSIVRLPPLPPVDVKRTVSSLDLTSQRKPLLRAASRISLNAVLSTPSALRMARRTCWSVFDSSVSTKRSIGEMVQKLFPPRDLLPL